MNRNSQVLTQGYSKSFNLVEITKLVTSKPTGTCYNINLSPTTRGRYLSALQIKLKSIRLQLYQPTNLDITPISSTWSS